MADTVVLSFEINRESLSALKKDPEHFLPEMRLALWQAASMAIQHNDELKAYYEKKRAEVKAHGTALGAVCRKLLVRVFVILKENRVYEARRA
jgi:hypothetical protein